MENAAAQPRPITDSQGIPQQHAFEKTQAFQSALRQFELLAQQLQTQVNGRLQQMKAQPAAMPAPTAGGSWTKLPKWRGLRGLLRSLWYGQHADNPDYQAYGVNPNESTDSGRMTLREYIELESSADQIADELTAKIVEEFISEQVVAQDEEIMKIINRFTANVKKLMTQSMRTAWDQGRSDGGIASGGDKKGENLPPAPAIEDDENEDEELGDGPPEDEEDEELGNPPPAEDDDEEDEELGNPPPAEDDDEEEAELDGPPEDNLSTPDEIEDKAAQSGGSPPPTGKGSYPTAGDDNLQPLPPEKEGDNDGEGEAQREAPTKPDSNLQPVPASDDDSKPEVVEFGGKMMEYPEDDPDFPNVDIENDPWVDVERVDDDGTPIISVASRENFFPKSELSSSKNMTYKKFASRAKDGVKPIDKAAHLVIKQGFVPQNLKGLPSTSEPVQELKGRIQKMFGATANAANQLINRLIGMQGVVKEKAKRKGDDTVPDLPRVRSHTDEVKAREQAKGEDYWSGVDNPDDIIAMMNDMHARNKKKQKNEERRAALTGYGRKVYNEMTTQEKRNYFRDMMRLESRPNFVRRKEIDKLPLEERVAAYRKMLKT